NTGALVSGPVKEASSVGAERSATAQGTQQSLVAACPPIHLQDVINAITPFLTVNQDSGIVAFDTTAALAAGVDQVTIQVGKQAVAFNNEVLRESAAGRSAQPGILDWFRTWLVPNVRGGANSDCGNFLRPVPNSRQPWNNAAICAATRQEAENALTAAGYHEVPWEFAGRQSTGNNWGKVVPPQDAPCNTPGAFRQHAILEQVACCWTYRWQELEPNPELNPQNYPNGFPYPLWPLYVWIWHRRF
ncbi:MAG TPA: hypothetical protein VFQ05_07360, partial [Candidatus Eisenbacteria bacterium]|nr:hypothetical protein [Candidatus Eisenbacteria bacterium]